MLLRATDLTIPPPLGWQTWSYGPKLTSLSQISWTWIEFVRYWRRSLDDDLSSQEWKQRGRQLELTVVPSKLFPTLPLAQLFSAISIEIPSIIVNALPESPIPPTRDIVSAAWGSSPPVTPTIGETRFSNSSVSFPLDRSKLQRSSWRNSDSTTHTAFRSS